MRILLVEDENAIAIPLSEGLGREGFAVDRAATVAEALEAEAADLVLLDLRLPDGDGLDVCRAMRARSDVPIIVVTARGEEADRVIGLELAAVDRRSARALVDRQAAHLKRPSRPRARLGAAHHGPDTRDQLA